MRKSYLNTDLIASLQRVLRAKNNEIVMATDLSDSTWRRINKKPSRITVQQILALANGMSIPVSRFFSPEGCSYIGSREDYIVTENFQKCYYDSEAVKKIIGYGNSITYKDAADALKLNWTRVAPVLLSVSRLPVTKFLDFCEAFYLNPFDYLVDPNPSNPVLLGKKRKQPDMGAASIAQLIEKITKEEVSQLRQEVTELRTNIQEMSTNFDNLMSKFDELSKSHNNLIHSIGVKIDSANHSHIVIANASEPESTKKGGTDL